jgi:hypothetical protein
MQGVPVSCQADPHTNSNAANVPAVMAVSHVGAGHARTIFQVRWRIPVPVRHRRQVHKVAKSNHCSQDQQAICSQVNYLQVWGPKQDHH